MSTSFATRPVVLANGARVPLDAAARNLGLLADYLANPDLEWDAVYYLREVCLDRPIEPEQTRTLVREKLLCPNGTVDPVMRAVVLSAVRGEGRVLHLTSPFTDPRDRAVAEFLNARVRALLFGRCRGPLRLRPRSDRTGVRLVTPVEEVDRAKERPHRPSLGRTRNSSAVIADNPNPCGNRAESHRTGRGPCN